MAYVEIVLISKIADVEWRLVWIFHWEFPFIPLIIPLYLFFSQK